MILPLADARWRHTSGTPGYNGTLECCVVHHMLDCECVNMLLFVHVCVCVCVCLSVCVWLCACMTHIACVCMCMHVCTCVYMCACLCMCVCFQWMTIVSIFITTLYISWRYVHIFKNKIQFITFKSKSVIGIIHNDWLMTFIQRVSRNKTLCILLLTINTCFWWRPTDKQCIFMHTLCGYRYMSCGSYKSFNLSFLKGPRIKFAFIPRPFSGQFLAIWSP